jgi:hypothetical protein
MLALFLKVLGDHDHQGSILHVALQPSPSLLPPSSHSSPRTIATCDTRRRHPGCSSVAAPVDIAPLTATGRRRRRSSSSRRSHVTFPSCPEYTFNSVVLCDAELQTCPNSSREQRRRIAKAVARTIHSTWCGRDNQTRIARPVSGSSLPSHKLPAARNILLQLSQCCGD